MKTGITNVLAATMLLLRAASALADVHYVDVNSTNATPPYTNWATAATNIQDAVDAAVAGDEVVVTDGIYATGGRPLLGVTTRVDVEKPLNVRSVNGPQSTTIVGRNGGSGLYRCVYLTDGATLSGFTLTSGLSGLSPGAGVRCSPNATVSNCVITGNSVRNFERSSIGGGAYGGTLNNCTLTGNSAGLNGSASSVEYFSAAGGGAAYCTLNNCVLSGNSTSAEDNLNTTTDAFAYGGGAYNCTLNNCMLSSNSAFAAIGSDAAAEAFAYGGGAYGCTLNNCVLTDNSVGAANNFTLPGAYAYAYGGGAHGCTLNNCALRGNSAGPATNRYGYYNNYGGGASWSTLNNCIGFSNVSYFGSSYESDFDQSAVSNCWFLDPLFVDYAGGNLRLQSNSPCINVGNNSYVTNATDLDGNPRIAGGTVDIGAYEFQSPVSQISYAWLQQYGLPITSSTDTADPDGDAVDNYHEWLAGTDPTNSLSSPAQLTITPAGVPPGGIILTWSTNAVGFVLQSTTNLLSPSAWITNSPAPVINGLNTVTNPITGAQKFYRLVH